MASHTSSMVITLVTLAGSRGVWASFSKSTCPSGVIRSADGAPTVTVPSRAKQGTASKHSTSNPAKYFLIFAPSKQLFA